MYCRNNAQAAPSTSLITPKKKEKKAVNYCKCSEYCVSVHIQYNNNYNILIIFFQQ